MGNSTDVRRASGSGSRVRHDVRDGLVLMLFSLGLSLAAAVGLLVLSALLGHTVGTGA